MERQQSLLCVGLDPLPAQFPLPFKNSPDQVLAFCTQIVDAVAAHVCAFKPQIAHFAALGAEPALAALIQYIHRHHPGIPVILDAKRGDIGSTAALYAQEAFERYQADAVTLNPYLGSESLAPFLARPEKGAVVLCRTSNPDNDLVQGHTPSDPLYLKIARKAASDWNRHGNLMLVAGATYPAELAAIRAAAPGVPLLVPGIGAQGGDLAAVLAAGLDADGAGLVISSSRAIIYASEGADFAAAAAAQASALQAQINALR